MSHKKEKTGMSESGRGHETDHVTLTLEERKSMADALRW